MLICRKKHEDYFGFVVGSAVVTLNKFTAKDNIPELRQELQKKKKMNRELQDIYYKCRREEDECME